MKTSEALRPYRYRLLGGLVGLILAILFLTIGFGPTLLIVVFATIGYLIGQWRDNALDVEGWIQFFQRD